MHIFGIDVGGSGIKGAIVDTTEGALVSERYRLPTPEQAAPDDVAAVIAEIVGHFSWQGPIGCAFPAVVKHGVTHSAANIHKDWVGLNAQVLLQQQTGCPVVLVNDADAAGIAEMRFGAGKSHSGVVFVLTFGTGIGSAVFVHGALFPNTELGHLELHGKKAEHYASDQVRKQKDLDWSDWTERVNEYLGMLDMLFSPDLIILGGGVSKKYGKYLHLLQTQASVVPAHLLNNAGIVGAALVAKGEITR
jgi:polyphosphate glucokinase